MQGLKHIVLLLLLFVTLSLFCSHGPPGSSQGSGTRIFFGPAYGFYQVNKNHAKNPIPGMSALAGFRKEVRIGREFKTFFLFGIDYFFHTLNFSSYYFKADSLKLYDKSFSYDYHLFVHEINLPMQFKYSFTRENNSMYSPYIMAGYHVRYLLPGILNITQNGNKIISDDADLQFKNPFLDKHINSFVSITGGWQKNSFNRSRSSFFIELNFRYGFSPFYFEKPYSASSLNISAMHLSLLLGLKF